ncbi:MAG TPA: hypothetical protein VGM06_16465 [Polyangiaceae bacterium]|jgi:hypothetical protein
MAAHLAWVLNLDADLELGAGHAYAPRRAVKVAMRAHAQRLAISLLGPGDVLVDESSPSLVARGFRGRAFCPTPRALDALRRAGAEPEPHPSFDVLRCVNSRAFAASLGPTMPGAAFVTDLDVARSILERRPTVGSAWRVKYAFGMTGRNQRVVRSPPLGESDLSFVRTGLIRGGIQLEPDVAIADEYAIHGLVAQDGSFRIGALVRQRCNSHGAWVSTERIESSGEQLEDVPARMEAEAHLVGHALSGAGYFGPFGVDAYCYRDHHGMLRLQPRSEINARYTMGFAVGWSEQAAP